jgi:hypothetical protein
MKYFSILVDDCCSCCRRTGLDKPLLVGGGIVFVLLEDVG